MTTTLASRTESRSGHRRPELVITPRDGIRDLRVEAVRDTAAPRLHSLEVELRRGGAVVDRTEEYQAELIERILRLAAGRDFVVGTHVWAFVDFATAQADHRPQSVNFKGVFTRDRRPKLAAHRLRQLWQR